VTDPATPPARTPPAAPRRIRALAVNLALSGITTAIFFLGLETILRLGDLAPADTLAFPDEETWARSPGPYDPNQEFVDRLRRGLHFRVRINALGFRGPEAEAAKRPGAYRILCAGDSYTFGGYVDEEETFPYLLERDLRERTGAGVEVINAGVNGYTITDEAAFLGEKGFALKPDAVVVGFVLNDLADLTRRVSSRENQRREAREMSASPFTPAKRALRRTATYNLLFTLKAGVVGRLGLDPTLHEVPARSVLEATLDARTEELLARYREELARLAEACRRRGVRLALVLFPYHEQVVGGAPAEVQSRVSRMAAELGVPCVDLLPAFRRAGPEAGRLFLMPLDHHPSGLGYRLAAAEVGAALGPHVAGAGPAR
jgi:lysophospholipase L1-like esterase